MIHTREGHRPDLCDCPPAKRTRGNPTLRIGDHGPMGRILIHGEPGHGIVDELAPIAGEIVIDKPGKGAFYATALGDDLARLGATHLVFAGVTTEVCVQTTMREANDRGFDCLLIEDATESYFPEFKAAALAMITRAGRHRRLDRAARGARSGGRGESGGMSDRLRRRGAMSTTWRRCSTSPSTRHGGRRW